MVNRHNHKKVATLNIQKVLTKFENTPKQVQVSYRIWLFTSLYLQQVFMSLSCQNYSNSLWFIPSGCTIHTGY